MSEKRCPTCGQTKPLNEFGRRTKAKDGRRTQCKACERIYARSHPEVGRAAARRYRQRHPEKVAAAKRRYCRANIALYEVRNKLERERNPKKLRARKAVDNAIQRGKIRKPQYCENCGSYVERPRDMHAHHEDYSRPLDVEWLCRDCHLERHRLGDTGVIGSRGGSV
jgi:hypothetical protein